MSKPILVFVYNNGINQQFEFLNRTSKVKEERRMNNQVPFLLSVNAIPLVRSDGDALL